MLRVLLACMVRYRLIKNGGTLHGFDKQSDPQLPSTITWHVSLFKEFTLLGIECSRMSNSITVFSCWDWPSTIQFLDGTYRSLHTSVTNFFLQRVTTLCNVRLKHQQPSCTFVLVSPLICASLEPQLPSNTLAITDSLSDSLTCDQC